MINPANLPNKALNHNCFLVYHETFFVVVLPKKELALYIEILMEPASPNQSASTKKITIQNKEGVCIFLAFYLMSVINCSRRREHATKMP